MHARALRSLFTVLVALTAFPLFAQGSENAIAAAVLFTVVMVGSVVAGLCIILLYLFKRRRWQRMFVLVFGAFLVIAGLALLAQQGAPQDIEFLGLLLGGAGVLFVALGALVRPRMVTSAHAKEK